MNFEINLFDFTKITVIASTGYHCRDTACIVLYDSYCQASPCYQVDSLSTMLPSSYGWGVLCFLTLKRDLRTFQIYWSAHYPKLTQSWVVRVSLALMKVAIKPAIIAETISAPANIKNWIRTSNIFQVQNLNSLLTCLKHPFKWPIRLVLSFYQHHHQNQLLETITAPKRRGIKRYYLQ